MHAAPQLAPVGTIWHRLVPAGTSSSVLIGTAELHLSQVPDPSTSHLMRVSVWHFSVPSVMPNCGSQWISFFPEGHFWGLLFSRPPPSSAPVVVLWCSWYLDCRGSCGARVRYRYSLVVLSSPI